MGCSYCEPLGACRLYAGFPDADLCWAGVQGRAAFTTEHNEWTVCNRPATAPLGLCDEHYETLRVVEQSSAG